MSLAKDRWHYKAQFFRSVLVCAVFAVLAWLIFRSRGQYCLPIFLGAGDDAASRVNPYLLQAGRPDFFKYGPIWAVFFIVLKWLHQIIGGNGLTWFWCWLNLVCFYFGSFFYWNDFRRVTRRVQRIRMGLVFLCLSPLALSNAFYGQINSLLLLLICLGLLGVRSDSSRKIHFLAGIFLAFASWMKVFPIIFSIFIFFPLVKLPREKTQAGFMGFLVGLSGGVLLPWLVWESKTVDIFRSWCGVLFRDLGEPHLKIGMASLLPKSWIGVFPIFQMIIFSAVFFRIIGADLSKDFSSFKRVQERFVLEGVLMLAVLLFSHMTEPPTLALAALPIIAIVGFSVPYELIILFTMVVILPSDFSPESVKNIFGGQYRIKTFSLCWMMFVLVRHFFSPTSRFRN